MTVKRIVTPEKYVGLAGDTKPTGVRPGATYYAYDTRVLYITNDDGTTWTTKSIVSAVHTEHPFAKGDLTSTGVQWSASTDTTTANTDVTIEAAKTIEPPEAGTIIEAEFGLTAGFKAVSSATADIIYKWQARDKGGTWVTLVTVTKTNIGTTEVEETYSGRFATVANFDAVPFDVQLVIQCNEANEGRARIKNSSYVKVIYNPT